MGSARLRYGMILYPPWLWDLILIFFFFFFFFFVKVKLDWGLSIKAGARRSG